MVVPFQWPSRKEALVELELLFPVMVSVPPAWLMFEAMLAPSLLTRRVVVMVAPRLA